MLLSDVCLFVTNIGNNSRTESPKKTKIGTQVAHVTRDSDITFKVKRSKVNLQGRGNIVADSPTSLIFINLLIFIIMASTYWNQGALGAAGVRDGLQLGRRVRAAAIGVQRAGAYRGGRPPTACMRV